MTKLKYVVFDNFHAAVVPPMNSHEHVKIENEKPTSAGFFRLFINEEGKMDVCCYGESHSLDMKPSAMDADYLKITLGLI